MTEQALLAGVRVLDLGQGIAGPCCADILRQQGAHVVKVEPPGGDWARRMGLARDGFSAVVLAYNAGKQGLCVDAGTAAGRDLVRRLASRVDVVVENFRSGVAERLGIGYEALASGHPGLIQVSISGFTEAGPLAGLPATDSVVQAASGLMYGNRDAAGVPRPVSGVQVADVAAGIHAAQLVCAALYRRALDGRGRHLRLSLYQVCCAIQAVAYAGTAFAEPAARSPAASAPGGLFRASDGYLTLAAIDEAMFERLCGALSLPHWPRDPRFGSNASRLQHARLLNEEVARLLLGRPLAEWVARLQAADVLHAAVRDHASVLADEELRQAAGMRAVSAAGADRALTAVSVPRTPGSQPEEGGAGVPRVGEHSIQVLQEHGFSLRDIESLLAAGVVREAQRPAQAACGRVTPLTRSL